MSLGAVGLFNLIFDLLTLHVQSCWKKRNDGPKTGVVADHKECLKSFYP